MERRYTLTHRQKQFVHATQTRVLFGGAAGGGKSYGQLLDALRYAISYPGSKQLILRRTYPDLERSIIRVSLEVFPKEIYTYNSSTHTGKFKNGSVIDFGYCASERDVYQYQGAEYDTIRFDELTHFTEYQYTYLISRLRGANSFPKQIKASTNPGGVGHSWVKSKFIDPAPPETEFIDADGQTCIFIPSKVQDNTFLMKADPGYIKRLEALDDTTKRALLYGDWDIFEGQYFGEFRREIHTCEPFKIPSDWRRYRAFDYGLDRLAVMWVAVDSSRNAFVYREYCESDLPIGEAAKQILERTEEDEEIYCTLAPPDIFSRTVDRGRSKAEMFAENGVSLTKSSNDREAGWLSIKELLREDANGDVRLHIFNTCRELIKCLPLLQHDPKKPTDCATEPHEITHACLTGDTLIRTPYGMQRIDQMPSEGGEIITYEDGKLHRAMYAFSALVDEHAETYTITLENGRTLECTGDHLILTSNRGWVQAKDLTTEDDVVWAEAEDRHKEDLL